MGSGEWGGEENVILVLLMSCDIFDLLFSLTQSISED